MESFRALPIRIPTTEQIQDRIKGQFSGMFNPRGRQLQKGLNNLKTTLLCGFVTILVLRGTLGAGKFGTPAQDVNLVRKELQNYQERRHRGETHRKLQAVMDTPDVDPNVPYQLGPLIDDWDLQRAEYISAHKGCNVTKGNRPKMMIVTSSQAKTCEHPVGDHLLLRALKNKIDYCRSKGIQIFYNMAQQDKELSGLWAKLPILRRMMLTRPDVEWFWWLEPDAFITDMKFNIPLKRYEKYTMVLHGYEDLVFNDKDWAGLNTGSFLIRNNQIGLDILHEWAAMGPKGKIREEAGKILTQNLKGRPPFEADDQSAMVWLMIQNRKKWGQHIYLENSYLLQGYWEMVSNLLTQLDKAEESEAGAGSDKYVPFVSHFLGCKSCSNFGDADIVKCIEEMNRAYHFADNQVLRPYGFQHSSLLSSAVKPLNITTISSIAESKGLQSP